MREMSDIKLSRKNFLNLHPDGNSTHPGGSLNICVRNEDTSFP